MKMIYPVTAIILLLSVFNESKAQTNSSVVSKTQANISSRPAVGSKTEQELMEITRQLTEAGRRGDKKVFERYFADDYSSTNMYGKVSKRAQILENMIPTPMALHFKTDFEDVQVREYGNMALLSVKANSHSENNGQQITQSYRATDVFMKQNGQWKLLSRHVSIIPTDKIPAKVNSQIYEGYVGEYEIFPDVILTITRDGDKLIGQVTSDKTKMELLPENETTFFEKGIRRQTIFVKNNQNQVSHVIRRLADGQEVTHKKIK
jgi:ketosteroid isomerase-like protein